MRGRVVGAFALGFALGAVGIGVALWSSGTLQTAYRPPWNRPALDRPAAPQSAPAPPLGDTSASAKLPAPPVPPPETATTGSADRAVPDAPLHLAMPLAGVDPQKLTDTFADARASHQHEALDITAPRGTPVMAVAEGNVAKLFNSKEGGLTVYQFDNTQQYAFYYAHLDSYAPNLKEGMLLRKGDTIGYVGTTGDAPDNAPHLHFAVFKLGPEKQWWKGDALNPLPMLR